MNLIDENIPAGQRVLLRGRRIAIRQIGHDIGRKGMHDEDIIPFLQRLRRPTFFTCDFDFYRPQLCHERYCLVWLDIKVSESAAYIVRVLKHGAFNTQAKRMGCVIAASATGISVWKMRAKHVILLLWDDD